MRSNVIRLEGYCRSDLERRNRKRLLSRLASTLMHSFHISEGDALVLMVGHGHERDNHEALISWINHELPGDRLKSDKETVMFLIRRLQYDLDSFREIGNE